MTWRLQIQAPASFSTEKYPLFIELNAGRAPELARAPSENRLRTNSRRESLYKGEGRGARGESRAKKTEQPDVFPFSFSRIIVNRTKRGKLKGQHV